MSEDEQPQQTVVNVVVHNPAPEPVSESAEPVIGDYVVRASFPGAEVKDDGAGPRMFGHLAVFNEWARVDSQAEGRFVERIAPGAFKKTISENLRAIRVLYDHGQDSRFGRRPLGRIADLREDERGVFYEVELLDTPDNRDTLLPGLRAGLYGSSFRFQPVKVSDVPRPPKSPANPDGWMERTVTELRMAEFGPTAFPVYASASAGVRSATDDYLAGRLGVDLSQLAAFNRTALPPDGAAPAHSDEGSRGTSAHEPLTPLSREEWLKWLSKN